MFMFILCLLKKKEKNISTNISQYHIFKITKYQYRPKYQSGSIYNGKDPRIIHRCCHPWKCGLCYVAKCLGLVFFLSKWFGLSNALAIMLKELFFLVLQLIFGLLHLYLRALLMARCGSQLLSKHVTWKHLTTFYRINLWRKKNRSSSQNKIINKNRTL